MEHATLGRNGPQVGALGLGCMGMSPGVYGGADAAEGIATIRAALNAAVTLMDTGDFYEGAGRFDALDGEFAGLHAEAWLPHDSDVPVTLERFSILRTEFPTSASLRLVELVYWVQTRLCRADADPVAQSTHPSRGDIDEEIGFFAVGGLLFFLRDRPGAKYIARLPLP